MEAGSSKRKVNGCIYDDSGTDRLNRNWKRSMMRIIRGFAMIARHEACPASGCQKGSGSCVPDVFKCMMGDVAISQQVPWKHAGLLSKRCHVAMPEILESDSDVGKVWRPTLMEGDEASWAIGHMLGDLVEVQEGIQMEMEYLQYSLE